MRAPWVFTIAVLLSFPNPANAAFLGLREAARFSLEHSPTLNSAQRETLIAEMERKNAGAALLPTVDLSAEHGLRRSYPSATSDPWASNVSIALKENLYDNGQSLTRRAVARLREEESRIQLLQARDRLLLQIGEAFYEHALAVKTLEIQEGQHALLRRQFEMVDNGYRQGLRTRKDYLRFKTQLSRADIDLVNARDVVTKATQELWRLLGLPPDSSEKPTFLIEEAKPSITQPLPVSLDAHRDLRIAALAEERQRKEEEQVRRHLWPELSFTAAASYGSSQYIGQGQSFAANDSLNWSALLGLQYNFLDWGTRRRESAIAAERSAIQANRAVETKINLRKELDQLALDFRRQRENFRLGEELLTLETRNLELITNEYRQGKVQYLDYITSLRDFADARIGYYTSLFAWKKGILAQQFHQGTLYETIME